MLARSQGCFVVLSGVMATIVLLGLRRLVLGLRQAAQFGDKMRRACCLTDADTSTHQFCALI